MVTMVNANKLTASVVSIVNKQRDGLVDGHI